LIASEDIHGEKHKEECEELLLINSWKWNIEGGRRSVGLREDAETCFDVLEVMSLSNQGQRKWPETQMILISIFLIYSALSSPVE